MHYPNEIQHTEKYSFLLPRKWSSCWHWRHKRSHQITNSQCNHFLASIYWFSSSYVFKLKKNIREIKIDFLKYVYLISWFFNRLIFIYIPNAFAIATFSKIAKRGIIIRAIPNFPVISPKLTYFSTTWKKNCIFSKFKMKF